MSLKKLSLLGILILFISVTSLQVTGHLGLSLKLTTFTYFYLLGLLVYRILIDEKH